MYLLYYVMFHKIISTCENKKEAITSLRKLLEIQLLYVTIFVDFFLKTTTGEKSMVASNT